LRALDVMAKEYFEYNVGSSATAWPSGVESVDWSFCWRQAIPVKAIVDTLRRQRHGSVVQTKVCCRVSVV
jgi:hypothetical protein